VSQEHVEIAKRALDAFNRRDLVALAEVLTPDFQLRAAFPASFERSAYHDASAAAGYIRDIDDTWQDFRWVVSDHRDLGDRVLLTGRYEARFRGGAAPVSGPGWVVYEFRDGSISRITACVNEHDALEALALED
jgi:ketosteroid isomerase-like protein